MNGQILTLGAQAQQGLQHLFCVSVCEFVCVCVSSYSRATGNEADGERYQRLQCHKRTLCPSALRIICCIYASKHDLEFNAANGDISTHCSKWKLRVNKNKTKVVAFSNF